MGFLTPAYVASGGTAVSIGAPVVSLPAGIQANDILILVVGTTGGEEPTADFGTWTYIGSRSDGLGTLDPGAAAFWHRYDGSTSPTTTIPDSGNHTVAEIHAYRNCKRTGTPIENVTTFGTTTPSATVRGKVITPTGLVSGEKCVGFWYTEGGNDHGGNTGPAWVGTGTADDQRGLRSYQYTEGDDGSMFAASAILDDTSSGVGPTWGVTTTLEEARISFQIMAHEYSELTRSVSDGLTSSDSIGRLAGYGRSVADALGLADAVGRLSAYTRGLADSVGFAESLARVQGWVRAASESVVFGDVATRVIGKVRATADALTLADSVARHFSVIRALSDALGLADVATRSRGKIRAVADSVTLSDSLRYLKSGIRALVTVTLAALTEIIATVKPLTWIADTISTRSAGTAITTEVGSLTDVETTVAPLASIDVEIE